MVIREFIDATPITFQQPILTSLLVAFPFVTNLACLANYVTSAAVIKIGGEIIAELVIALSFAACAIGIADALFTGFVFFASITARTAVLVIVVCIFALRTAFLFIEGTNNVTTTVYAREAFVTFLSTVAAVIGIVFDTDADAIA